MKGGMMKNSALIVLACFILLFSACGSGGSKSTPKTAPEIGSLVYYPSSAAQWEGGGAVMIEGQVDYRDPEGNIATATIITPWETETRPVSGVEGEMYGTIYGSYVMDTTEIGEFQFYVYVTDTTGLSSNTLSGVFTVY
jgi:hypothetical protein